MIKVAAAFIGVFLSGLALCTDTYPLLTQLREDLGKARALPMGEKTSYRCPLNLNQLKGIPLDTVLTTLPKPDYKNSGSVSYFLTSPITPGQKGGGFPVITFVSGKSGTVEQITCFLSK